MQNKNEFWVSILTAFSCIAVVYLHVNNIFWTHPTGWLWITSNIIECVFYFAVPVFLMISGYTLLDYRKKYNTKTFIKKRLIRTFIPFVFWSSVFFFVYGKKDFFSSIINIKIEHIYYFFPLLFACYLAIIFFSLVHNKKKIFSWLFLWCFVSYSIIPFLEKSGTLYISDVWKNPIGCSYLLFIFLGYILGHTKFQKKERFLLYALGLIGLGFHMIGTHLATPPHGRVDMIFKNYENWPCVLYSAAIFVYFKHIDWSFIAKCKILTLLLETVASCSLGVYLLHGYFVYHLLPTIFTKFGHKIVVNSDIYRIFAPPIIVLGICFLIIIASKLIPSKFHFLLGYKRTKLTRNTFNFNMKK